MRRQGCVRQRGVRTFKVILNSSIDMVRTYYKPLRDVRWATWSAVPTVATWRALSVWWNWTNCGTARRWEKRPYTNFLKEMSTMIFSKVKKKEETSTARPSLMRRQVHVVVVSPLETHHNRRNQFRTSNILASSRMTQPLAQAVSGRFSIH